MNTKLMNIKLITIVTGEEPIGLWFAFSPEIPWLAAEGESFAAVCKFVADITPVLARMHGIEGPIELVWRPIGLYVEIGI